MIIKRSILAAPIALLPGIGTTAIAQENLVLEEVIVTVERDYEQ